MKSFAPPPGIAEGERDLGRCLPLADVRARFDMPPGGLDDVRLPESAFA